ncbi:MAG: choice-of-anchor Q domain-containing protein [Candidatus Binataceae bacterium]
MDDTAIPRKRQLLTALVGACLMLVSSAVCRAATFTVNNLGDTGTGSGTTGDLRYAINQANSAASGDITFSVTGTITVDSTLPAITANPLTIIGPTSSSSGITIDGNNSVQIMLVNSGATVTLQNLTLAHGGAAGSAAAVGLGTGGAILNQGTLVITNCAFLNNQVTGGPGLDNSSGGLGRGGAIFNSGLALITNSTFSGNLATGGSWSGSGFGLPGYGQGGAIQNWGPLTITSCTFSANQATGGSGTGGSSGAGMGGAIDNENGNMTVTNTTFSGNQANGGVAWGGAVNGNANISNSTFSGNEANGTGGDLAYGGAINGGTNITNSTFSGNQAIGGSTAAGGGIAGAPNITNSTFSGNLAMSGPGGDDEGGAIAGAASLKGTILAASTPVNCAFFSAIPTDLGYNLSDDKSQCGLIQPTSDNSVSNIGLASGLADNGGPTETIALQPGGFANALIPTANCTDQSIPPQPLTSDQRGYSRPAPTHPDFCSAGAYEFNSSGPPTPTSTATATATRTATPIATASATATPTVTPTPVPVTLKVAPEAIKFPKTTVGTPSTPRTVKVSNPKSNAKHLGMPVLIEMISDNPGVFTETHTCPPTLVAGAVCSITVTFTPNEAAKQFGTLVITDNANGSPQTVPLSGTGK